jgi:hypothetical protein
MTNLLKNLHNENTNIILFVKGAKDCLIGENALNIAAQKLNIDPLSLKVLIDIQVNLKKGVKHG